MPDTAPDQPSRAREAILELLGARGPQKTICPSEAARALAGDEDFRPYMEPVREAARPHFLNPMAVDATPIVPASLGDRSGAVGAAILASQRMGG